MSKDQEGRVYGTSGDENEGGELERMLWPDFKGTWSPKEDLFFVLQATGNH